MQGPLLFLSVFIIATCGLGYELIAGTVASYLLGDSVTQFSTVIGLYLFALGIGAYLSGEYGHQWLGTTDAFYLNTALPDYNTWNVGIGFTYKVFTLDLRYSGTDLSKEACNAITSDFTAKLNPSTGTFQSKWCGDQFIAKLSADVTLGALK